MRILVIGDKPQHLEEAKAFFAKLNIYVSFAKTLSQAIPGDSVLSPDFSKLEGFDGIISDVHFPLTDDPRDNFQSYTGEHPIGVSIAWYASTKKIPCVLITDLNHHGPSVQWVCLTLVAIIGFAPIIDDESESGGKNWAGAWERLEKMMKEKSESSLAKS